jgi:membrane protein required for colicin V production
MLLDILISVPLLFFIILGARDGIVRKLVASVVLIAGLILGQIFMRDVGEMLVGRAGISHDDAPTYGFLLIFFGLFIVQSLLYKILTGSYKIGGVADRIGGTVVGFIEGALLVSSLLFIFAMSGFPDRQTKRDARFYKPFVNIAPQILDLTSTVGPEVLDKLKDIGTADSADKKTDTKETSRSAKPSKTAEKK